MTHFASFFENERQPVTAARPASPLLSSALLAALALALAAPAAAAEGPHLPVWRERMQPLIPLGYVARHTSTPLTIDGQLDDPAWAAAPWTADFVDIEGDAKPKPRFRTRAKLLWDDEFLYIAAELAEPHLWGTLTKHDAVIFNDPDFEVFLDPDGDTHAYYEFELNALNTGWDLLLPRPYQDGGKARDDWEIPGLKTAIHLRGTLNNPADTDVGWTLEIAFPWKALAAHARHPGPPAEGEQWRVNFSRVEWSITVRDGRYHKVPRTPENNWVWSPQGVIDMHRPEMWGTVQFTRRPVAEPAELSPLAGKPARDLALDFYYAQLDFCHAHQRWATTLAELNWAAPAGSAAPGFRVTLTGYEFTVPFTDGPRPGTWTTRQDRRLTLE
ncbi:MAG: hypothetical protein EXS32_04490 [Opitutus sp.]|nr:hypothetical protein [Opitutus sp.]